MKGREKERAKERLGTVYFFENLFVYIIYIFLCRGRTGKMLILFPSSQLHSYSPAVCTGLVKIQVAHSYEREGECTLK